MNLFLTVVE